mmetsp:Transcript_6120/g.19222  ORF Transcript_6120/g.19222 Transcript_6120/m.19222 type:complete len:246 (-) Transcript_6120:2038-2775(-)
MTSGLTSTASSLFAAVVAFAPALTSFAFSKTSSFSSTAAAATFFNPVFAEATVLPSFFFICSSRFRAAFSAAETIASKYSFLSASFGFVNAYERCSPAKASANSSSNSFLSQSAVAKSMTGKFGGISSNKVNNVARNVALALSHHKRMCGRYKIEGAALRASVTAATKASSGNLPPSDKSAGKDIACTANCSSACKSAGAMCACPEPGSPQTSNRGFCEGGERINSEAAIFNVFFFVLPLISSSS